MTEWLYKQDDYKVKNDKDAFIDKSILSILDVLTIIKRETMSHYHGGIYEVNSLVKLISTILLLVLISLSKSPVFIIFVDIYLIAIIISLEKGERKKIILSSLTIPLFTLIMLIPSILIGNVQNSMLLCLKISSSAAAVGILAKSTKWDRLTEALKMLYIPDIFILVMELAVRYIYILGEFSLCLLYSLKLRSVGKNNNKYTHLSGIMGVLFMKSKDMGEEVNSAMGCRGFTGEYTEPSKFTFGLRDILFSTSSIILIVLYLFCNRMWSL